MKRKYLDIPFFDVDTMEARKIVDVRWIVAPKNAKYSSCYQVISKTIQQIEEGCQDEDEFEMYLINQFLLSDCPPELLKNVNVINQVKK